ncbi:MAG TPA: GGDEF domain-containing protein [Burkholderiaceae bacterium]|nr:GGDEF domain-containing protein [Burkholderiaceae bacterium]
MQTARHRSDGPPASAANEGVVHDLPVAAPPHVPAGTSSRAPVATPRDGVLRRFFVDRPTWITIPALVAVSVIASVGALFLLTELMGLGYGPTFRRSITIATVAPILVSAPIGGFVVRLLREVDAARRHAQDLAWLDALTGLANRRRIAEVGADALARTREAGTDCAVALMDVDDFKRVNDTFGHGAGDAVLQGVARALSGAMGPGDHAARWGGEEFVVLMPGAPMVDARERAERLRAAVEGLAIAAGGGRPVRCTVSIGLATAGRLDTFEQLVNRADRAMYRAKADGKNRVAVG